MNRHLIMAVIFLVLFFPTSSAATLVATDHQSLCFLDIDGDGSKGFEDPLYLKRGICGALTGGDIRLQESLGYPGGTIMDGSHKDSGKKTLQIAGSYRYFDADGSGSYSTGDLVYVKIGGEASRLQPGDIPLNGESRYSPLTDPSPLPLLATLAVGDETYSEHDGMPGFTPGDVLYLDFGQDGYSSIGDLRIGIPTPKESSNPASSSSTTSDAAERTESLPNQTVAESSVKVTPDESAARPEYALPLMLGTMAALLAVAMLSHRLNR